MSSQSLLRLLLSNCARPRTSFLAAICGFVCLLAVTQLLGPRLPGGSAANARTAAAAAQSPVAPSATPVLVSSGPSRLDAFIRGADRAMWHKWWNGSTWTAWESLGGIVTSNVAAVSWAANRIDLVALGGDSGL